MLTCDVSLNFLFEPTALSFSGHETFRFRYTWLPKAVQQFNLDGEIFNRDDAFVRLGVGKNMVRSMRHWSQSMGLMERNGTGGLTTLGKSLFLEDGWDPYLEDIGTLWLLHWQLVSTLSRATTWHFSFTRWGRERFTREQLSDWLFELAEKAGDRTSRETIKRDVDVFVLTYVASETSSTVTMEETFDCPLVELGLIREVDTRTYEFVRGDQPTLPDEMFVFALTQHWNRVAPERKTLEVSSLFHGPGSLGGAFKLSENALIERLVNLPQWCGMSYDETAGLKQLLKIGDLSDPVEALGRYYKREVA